MADIPPWQEDLPPEMQVLLTRGEAVTIGRSGMQVWHVEHGYLKIHQHDSKNMDALSAEKDRLVWLQGRLPVPRVYAYGKGESCEYLLLSEIPGVMACDQQFREDRDALITLIAEALHMVHAIPQEQCPFSRPLEPRLAKVQDLMEHGQVDQTRILQEQGLSLQAWHQQLEHRRPAAAELVFTHGDFCLPNLFIDPQHRQITGIIDWGQGGVADRHEDLRSACWSLGYNFDPAWIPLLKYTYGEELIDADTLTWYQMFAVLSL